MPKFVVNYLYLPSFEIVSEIIEAEDWKRAVEQHKHYPYQAEDGREFESVEQLVLNYPKMQKAEAFKQVCFDADCTMNWVELEPESVPVYCVQATVNGNQLPTFYLHEDVQGIVSCSHAEGIAYKILDYREGLYVSASVVELVNN